MKDSPTNIFEKIKLPLGDRETFESLLKTDSLHVERIISNGQKSDKWYDSSANEWVVLLQGKASLEYENGSCVHLKKGDFVFIPARKKHRVNYTSQHPHCIWLAIHFA